MGQTCKARKKDAFCKFFGCLTFLKCLQKIFNTDVWLVHSGTHYLLMEKGTFLLQGHIFGSSKFPRSFFVIPTKLARGRQGDNTVYSCSLRMENYCFKLHSPTVGAELLAGALFQLDVLTPLPPPEPTYPTTTCSCSRMGAPVSQEWYCTGYRALCNSVNKKWKSNQTGLMV